MSMTGTLFVKDMPPVNRLFTLTSTTPDATKPLASTGGMLLLCVLIRAVRTGVAQLLAMRGE